MLVRTGKKTLGRILVLALLATAQQSWALDPNNSFLLDPNTLCASSDPNTPCVVEDSHDLSVECAVSCTLDVGSRTLKIQDELDIDAGCLLLRAEQITFTGSGQINGFGGVSSPGGRVDVQANGNIAFNSSVAQGSLFLSGDNSNAAGDGSADITSVSGSVTATAKFTMQGTGADSDGGDLAITALNGAVDLANTINLRSGTGGEGGDLDITAVSTNITGEIDLKGGGDGAGEIDILTDGAAELDVVNIEGSGDGGLGGTLSISAGSINLNHNILATGSGSGAETCGDGGSVDLVAQDTMAAPGPITILGWINVNALAGECDAGSISITTASDVLIQNDLLARGTGNDGDGGTIDLDASGNLLFTGAAGLKMAVDGADTGSGGDIFLDTSGDPNDVMNIDGLIDFRGGEDFPADLTITAVGDVILGELRGDGRGLSGTASGVDITADGKVTFTTLASANGSGSGAENCGDGNNFNVIAGEIDVQSTIDVNAPSGSCTAGSISLSADHITMSGALKARGSSTDGGGGSVDLDGETIVITGPIETDGGTSGGGDVDITATSDVTASGDIEARTRRPGANGATIRLLSGGLLNVQGGTFNVRANDPNDFNGDVTFDGCMLLVEPGVTVLADDAQAAGGQIVLEGNDFFRVAGSFNVEPIAGSIDVRYGPDADPNTVGATFDPSANIPPAPNVLSCVVDPCAPFGGDADGDGICDDGGANGTNNDQPCACTGVDDPNGCAAGCDDNCPWAPNPDQLDQGSVNSTAQDGIGDKCQCGDINGDGKITGGDGTIIKRFTIGLPPGLAVPELCDVNGLNDDDCSGGDGTIIKRATIGLAPGVKQLCAPAQPPGVFPQTDPPPVP